MLRLAGVTLIGRRRKLANDPSNVLQMCQAAKRTQFKLCGLGAFARSLLVDYLLTRCDCRILKAKILCVALTRMLQRNPLLR